jgi:hypothetical protein
VTKPFVSVLIDTYNHERFIEQAIVSVLEQDYTAGDREIVVVDDGSTDRTPEIIRKFEPRVRLLRKVNGGQGSAFNAGIAECRGEIITFLDGDDWWVPSKLRKVTQIMAEDRAIALVGHGIIESFQDGTERTFGVVSRERFRLNSLANAQVFRFRKSYLGTSRMTLRTAVARQLLPVPEALVIEADEYLFTMAAAAGDMVILPEALCHYRFHDANLYISAGANPASLRRKQKINEALAVAFRGGLPALGVPPDAVECVTEIIQAEADQIRLMLDGGAPWQTVRTENKIYSVMHRGAPLSHRIFRWATMLPACVLPPRWFYAGRSWLSAQNWYRGARKKVLRPPNVSGVAVANDNKL